MFKLSKLPECDQQFVYFEFGGELVQSFDLRFDPRVRQFRSKPFNKQPRSVQVYPPYRPQLLILLLNSLLNIVDKLCRYKKSFKVEIINITYEVRRLEAVDEAWLGLGFRSFGVYGFGFRV